MSDFFNLLSTVLIIYLLILAFLRFLQECKCFKENTFKKLSKALIFTLLIEIVLYLGYAWIFSCHQSDINIFNVGAILPLEFGRTSFLLYGLSKFFGAIIFEKYVGISIVISALATWGIICLKKDSEIWLFSPLAIALFLPTSVAPFVFLALLSLTLYKKDEKKTNFVNILVALLALLAIPLNWLNIVYAIIAILLLYFQDYYIHKIPKPILVSAFSIITGIIMYMHVF